MQRVVHLEYEHAANIEACHAAGEKTLLKDTQDHKTRMLALAQTRLELVAALEREEDQRAEEIRTMRDTERKETAKLRDKFERQHQALKAQYEDRLERLQQELDVRRRLELHEAGERHNTHLNTLIWNHEAKVEETRAYYVSITKDHVALITELQQRVAELHAHQAQGRESLAELEQQRQAVSAPVRESAAQVAVLSSHEVHMQRCTQSLAVMRGRLSTLNAKVQTLRSGRVRLSVEHKAAREERERLRQAWEGIVSQAEAGAGARAEQLEQTLAQLQEAYRGENARLGAALRAGALDAGVARRVAAKLDSVLGAKQEQVEQLRYEVARAGKMHDDWHRVMRAKLVALGIPEEDVGAQELLGCANTAPTGILTK
jgi:intracellular sulfur oxidation DsrE/DsrF family protein